MTVFQWISYTLLLASFQDGYSLPVDGLTALYNSMYGSGSWNATNWMDDGDPCTGNWVGVICNGTAIVELDLKAQGLNGSIPSEFGYLTDISSVKLQSTYLYGSLPSQIGALKSLLKLVLSSNQLTGEFPEQIANLRALTSLKLASNSFCGELPVNASLVAISETNNNYFGTECCAVIPPLPAGLTCQPTPVPTIYSECSASSCTDLGWSTTANGFGDVCASSSDSPLTSCSSYKRWSTAKTFCQSVGARLCTMSELADESEGYGTGCGYDSEYIWSSTSCGASSYYAVYGGGVSEQSNYPPSCLAASTADGPRARCCADEACTQSPTLTPAPTLIPTLSIEPSPVPTLLPSTSKPSSTPTLIPSLSHSPTSLPTTSPEADVLRQLYVTLGGVGGNWATDSNWGLDSSPCSSGSPWAGVTCSSSSDHIMALDLNNNDLNGLMPSEVGMLVYLTSLDLGDNSDLSGILPSELALLTSLTEMAIGTTQMTGSIPSQFAQLVSLELLELQSNGYTGSIPSELGELSDSLLSIQFNHNSLTSSVPSEIGLLSHLTYLQVQSNLLCGTVATEISEIFSDALQSAFEYGGQDMGTPCPTPSPTFVPTYPRTPEPTLTPQPTPTPSKRPSTGAPSLPPTPSPSLSVAPTDAPTLPPTYSPTDSPTLVPTPLANQQSGNGRVEGAISEWQFYRQECLEGGPFSNEASSGVFGDIARNDTSNTICPDFNGISQPANLSGSTGATITSRKPLSELINLAPKGFTFEMWAAFNATNDDTSGEILPIWLFGQGNSQGSSFYIRACDETPWYDFALVARSGILEVSAPNQQNDDDYCLTTISSALEFRPYKHFVVSVNGTALSVFLDGNLSLYEENFYQSVPIQERWADFHPDFHLQLLSTASVLSDSTQPISATVYFATLYDWALSLEEVQSNYGAKLVNSKPVVVELNVTVVEDGELVCGSSLNDPESYREPISPVTSLTSITLDLYDGDNDKGHPNYDYNLAMAHPPTAKVASLPSRGQLYQTEGSNEEITEVGTVIVSAANGSSSVYYRPEKDAYAPNGVVFDSFKVTAIDGISGQDSIETGKVLVFVTACNDPPLARNGSSIALSSTATDLYLNATDVDDDVIQQSFITGLPKLSGAFLQTWDGSEYVTVDSVPWAVGSTGLVVYTYNGTEDAPILDVFGTFAYDRFKFSVMDPHGANSSDAYYDLTVRLPLAAEASSENFADDDAASKLYTVYEATKGNISVYSSDLSDKKREVAVRIRSIPRHGTLYDAVTGAQVYNGTLLNSTSSYPYSEPVLVTYIGNPNYFNSPKLRYNGTSLSFQEGDDDDSYGGEGGVGNTDTFTFTTELASDSKVVTLYATQAVVVVNVNDKPKLTAPKKFNTLAIGSSADDDGDELVISGIKFSDVDRDVDPVKVLVSCSYGYMSLSPIGVAHVDFNSFDLCYGHDDWSCSGDGDGDRTMVFVGQPSAVAKALSSITYQTTYSFITDFINIAIYDGQRSDSYTGDDGADTCLELEDFSSVSRRGPGPFNTECFVVNANITIEVGEFANSDSTVTKEKIENNTQLAIAAGVFVIFVLFCILRVMIAKTFGWKLQGVPTGEEEWDSDEPSDDEFDVEDADDNDDEDDDDEIRLERKKSRRKSRKTQTGKNMLSSLSSGVAKRASMWVGRGGGSEEGHHSLEMTESTPNPVATASGVSVSPGRGGSKKNIGFDEPQVDLRDSIAQATTIRKLVSSHNIETAGGGSGGDNEDTYQFIPTEWRRHKDKDGHTFFHHIPSGVTTYAMPWVLSAGDLAKPVHDANNPTNWRAVETGRLRKDGTPITLYYNRVTKQSTFDVPMFATWGSR